MPTSVELAKTYASGSPAEHRRWRGDYNLTLELLELPAVTPAKQSGASRLSPKVEAWDAVLRLLPVGSVAVQQTVNGPEL